MLVGYFRNKFTIQIQSQEFEVTFIYWNSESKIKYLIEEIKSITPSFESWLASEDSIHKLIEYELNTKPELMIFDEEHKLPSIILEGCIK